MSKMRFNSLFCFALFFFINQVICDDIPTYKEFYFEQNIDHFNPLLLKTTTYQQRYLVNDTWWNPSKGPIFFYTGNEGEIESFWNNTGFVFETAPKFGALVIFAEHRYYGKSMPFGNKSLSRDYIGWLTIDQALADYAYLLDFIQKTKCPTQRCPVISFGGSYGGMLSTYFRFKYPNIVDGAIAASAPIFQIAGYQSGEQFFQAITKDFKDCEPEVRQAFIEILGLFNSGTQKLKQSLKICQDVTTENQYVHLLKWIRNAFVMAAMMDYPYPATFMGQYPAYPVKEMCKRIKKADNLIAGFVDALALTYNNTQDQKCFDINTQYRDCSDPTGCGLGPASYAWDYQCCTQMNLVGGSTNVTDMFPEIKFDSKIRDNYCSSTWGIYPRNNWLRINFWGEDIEAATNIVFSNGDLDPWAPGGVHQNMSSVKSVVVNGGAHHLDLRFSNPLDPPSVVQVRQFHVSNIHQWIKEAKSKRNKFSLKKWTHYYSNPSTLNEV